MNYTFESLFAQRLYEFIQQKMLSGFLMLNQPVCYPSLIDSALSNFQTKKL